MSKQQEAAAAAMTEWLSDEHELGKAPAKIECAGEFDLHDLHYYIFKYKKTFFGKWLLGVCGGYEAGAVEHCGHVFSEMQEYREESAKEQAVSMVEMIREYWMTRGKEQQSEEEGGRQEETAPENQDQTGHSGSFLGFVLLDECSLQADQLKAELLQEWGIQVEEDEEAEVESSDDDTSPDHDSYVWNIGNMIAAVSLMPAPVPDDEAVQNAANNYMWPEAVETAGKHTAHLLVAVMNQGESPIDAGNLFVKLCCACLKQEHAIGLYTSGTVFQPQFYLEAAQMLKDGGLPVLNLIYFGLYQGEHGMCGYTYGMTAFGREEIEVLDSEADFQQIREFLFNVVYYCLDSGVELHDGETIGFTEDQKLRISRSEGAAVEGYSLKINL